MYKYFLDIFIEIRILSVQATKNYKRFLVAF